MRLIKAILFCLCMCSFDLYAQVNVTGTIGKIKSTFRKNKKCHFTHFCKKQKVNEGTLSSIHYYIINS